MNTFNFKNMLLAYEAVHDESLCESMDDLGFFDNQDKIDEQRQTWDKPRGNRPSPRDRAADRQSQFSQSGSPLGNRIRSSQIGAVRANMRQAIDSTPPSQLNTAGPIASARFKAAAIRTRGGRPGSTPIQTVPGLRAYNQGVQSALENIRRLQPNRQNPPGQRFGISSIGIADDYNVYDLVFNYLIDEGYTDTIEGGVAILENMSDEWLNSILNEYR